MNKTNDVKHLHDIFFRDEQNIQDTFELANLVVSIDMSSIRQDGTKDNKVFKDEMKENKLEFLTLRENRTALNGLRRFIFKDVKGENLQEFDAKDVVAMVKHEKFKSSKMSNFQTVVNNTKKYLDIVYGEDTRKNEKTVKPENSSTDKNDENSNVDTFENFYNQLEKTLKSKSLDFEKVLTIQELVNNVVDKRRKEIKIAKAS
jgi:hypothetical protein